MPSKLQLLKYVLQLKYTVAYAIARAKMDVFYCKNDVFFVSRLIKDGFPLLEIAYLNSQ
jgi:hypothetical protein